MKWGIRRPVSSSPYFAPNRHKLGMKSLAPCQLWKSTGSSWLLCPQCLREVKNLIDRVNCTKINGRCCFFLFIAAARYFSRVSGLYLILVLCFASLRVRILMSGWAGPVGVIVLWSDLREIFFCCGGKKKLLASPKSSIDTNLLSE